MLAVFIVDPSLPVAAQQQALHTVTREFFEVGTPEKKGKSQKVWISL